MRRIFTFDEQNLFLEDVNKLIENFENDIKDTFSVFSDGFLNNYSGGTFLLTGLNGVTVSIGKGLGYKDGERIEISENLTYSSTNPNSLINGICVPKSTGNLYVPLTQGITNYVWVTPLLTLDESYTDNHSITGLTYYTKKLDGYKVFIDTTLPTATTGYTLNSLFLGLVNGTTLSVAGKLRTAVKF